MVTSAVQRYYRRQAGIYDATRWIILRGRNEAVRRLRLRPDSLVLEVGCGTGLNFGRILSRLDRDRGRLVGLDFSEDMIVRAKRRMDRHGWRQVFLVRADATRAPWDSAFDAVLFSYSLTMIPDWRDALRRAWDSLRAGGRIVVVDFGMFEGWSPLHGVPRWWLRLNHVDVAQPYAAELERLAGAVQWTTPWGGYCFIASAEKR